MRAFLGLSALILALPFAGCLGGGSGTLSVSVTAPISENALILNAGLSGSPFTGDGSFVVKYNGAQVYPAQGSAKLAFRDGQGSVRVPYRDFVRANGDYEVEVRVKEAAGRSTATITKFIDSLRVIARYETGAGVLRATSNFFSGTSVGSQGPVYTNGNATVAVLFERDALPRTSKNVTVESDFSFTTDFDRDVFFTQNGNYTVRVTFDNSQASGNRVTNDPRFGSDVVLIVE